MTPSDVCGLVSPQIEACCNLRSVLLLAGLAANAIIRQRAQRPNDGRGTDNRRIAQSLAAVRSSWEALGEN